VETDCIAQEVNVDGKHPQLANELEDPLVCGKRQRNNDHVDRPVTRVIDEVTH
jgi:hypothetical protein